MDDVNEKYEKYGLQKKAFDLEKEFGMAVDSLTRLEESIGLGFDDLDYWFAESDPCVSMDELERLIEERAAWIEQVHHLVVDTPRLEEGITEIEKLSCMIEDLLGQITKPSQDRADRPASVDGAKRFVAIFERTNPVQVTTAESRKAESGREVQRTSSADSRFREQGGQEHPRQ